MGQEKEWKPVAFCSWTVIDKNRQYAQIENDCLASVNIRENLEIYVLSLYKLTTGHRFFATLINVVLEEALESPLECKENKPIHSEGNQP